MRIAIALVCVITLGAVIWILNPNFYPQPVQSGNEAVQGWTSNGHDTADSAGEIPSDPLLKMTSSQVGDNVDLAALIESATAGSPDAAYALFRLTAKCKGVETSDMVNNLIAVQLEVGMRDEISQKLWSEHTYCQDMLVQIPEDQADPRYWGDEAENLGHPVFIARDLAQTAKNRGYAEADKMAISILQSGNLDAFPGLISFLMQRDAEFPYDLRTELGIPTPETRGASMMVLACTLGWKACNGGSDAMWVACGNKDSGCDPNADLISQYSQVYWTPQEFENGRILADRYRQALLQEDYETIIGPSLPSDKGGDS